MSLVNQMLRDLDARNAPAVDRAALPISVHALPRRRAAPVPLLVAGVALLAAAGGWYAFDLAGKPAPAAPPVQVAAAPVPAPAAPPPTIAAPAAPASESAPAGEAAVATPVPTPASMTEPAPAPKPPAERLIQPAKAKEPPPPPRPRQEARPASPAAATAAVAAPVPTHTEAPKPQEPAAVADNAKIEMRPLAVTLTGGAEAEYRKAMAALRRGAASEANEGLHAALRLDNKHASARQALLGLLVEQQRWPEAQALLEEGLALDATQTGWAMLLARLQVENGRIADAVDTLARHAPHAERNAEYRAFQALLLQKLKRPHDAIEHYRAALAIRPTEARWWYGLGLVLDADQNPQEARTAYLKARELGNLPPELVGAVEQKLR